MQEIRCEYNSVRCFNRYDVRVVRILTSISLHLHSFDTVNGWLLVGRDSDQASRGNTSSIER